MRVDTPTSNNIQTYDYDAKSFKRNPRRKLIIRPAFFNEFDIEVDLSQWQQLPKLHCLVNQLSIGVHFLTPVYRGAAFFHEVTTDSEVIMIVAEMAKRGGIDVREWEQFERAYNLRLRLTDTSDGIVN
jgi:hypothetical protein